MRTLEQRRDQTDTSKHCLPLPNDDQGAMMKYSIAIRSLFFVVAASLMITVMPAVCLANGVANSFYVNQVRVDKNGHGYVSFAQPLQSTPPACVSSTWSSVLAFDATTAGGKAILALALTAKATGKPIWAQGTGQCTIYSQMEDWSFGLVNP